MLVLHTLVVDDVDSDSACSQDHEAHSQCQSSIVEDVDTQMWIDAYKNHIQCNYSAMEQFSLPTVRSPMLAKP